MNAQSLATRFDPALLSLAVITILGGVEKKPWEMTGADGKQFTGTSFTQKAKLEVGGFAYPFKVKLQNPEDAYPVGEYVLDVAAMLTVQKEVK